MTLRFQNALTCALMIVSTMGFSQESINSSGGDLANPAGSVNYSVGQLFYNRTGNALGAEAQGVQHPVLLPTEINESTTRLCDLKFQQTSSHITISLEQKCLNHFPIEVKVFAVDGKLVLAETISPHASGCSLNMNLLNAGIYLIRIHSASLDQSIKFINP